MSGIPYARETMRASNDATVARKSPHDVMLVKDECLVAPYIALYVFLASSHVSF